MLVRAPVVMAPLALVFIGHSTRSFAIGGLLAAAYALGEAAGAPFMGRRFDTRPFVGELRLALGLEGTAFVALAVSAAFAPVPVLIALTFLAGAGAAGVSGGMRAQLSATTPSAQRPTALSLESTLGQTVWALAPSLVSLLYAISSAQAVLVVMAVITVAPAFFARRIPHTDITPGTKVAKAAPMRTIDVLRMAWPTALLSATVMSLIGTVDVLLPARLDSVHASAAWAGPVMAVFAGGSVIAALLYGSRHWPGTPRSQTLVLLPAISVAFAIPGVTSQPVLFAAAFALGGLLYSPLMVIRNLALQQALPQTAWATGFSTLYAAAGLGYGIAGILSSVLLSVTDAGTAFLACTAITLVLGAASLLGERMHRTTTAPEQADEVHGDDVPAEEARNA
ncbi:hypothetical protein AQJ84_24520 [Streptomyces resistomycificus]|uniref:MFS transporter n=2 Tax=Streptomyces resistomycificus TaxID=67356 RepID=A0A0L8LG91_9ACTN|nr:hypothetical protein ADK37_12800 [Streptomyces resistomycificus]KUN95217.1 hypothetical protein AQJ84_24520 [Streptomyces resistomycificus]